MRLRHLAVTAAISLAAFSVAANAAPHRKHRHHHHPYANLQRGPDQAWRAGGVWKEDPWLSYNERDWLDAGGAWHHDHDRYWQPTFERREYVPDAQVFAMLKRHGFDAFQGAPFWYHGHYLVRAFRGRYIDLVEVNPYTNKFIGRLA